MTRALVKEIMDAVDALDSDEASKVQFRSAVRRVCTAHGFHWVAKDDRMAFARELLLRKVSRSTIRDRLIACYGISWSQAYRSIASALKLAQNQRPNAMESSFNEASEPNSIPHEKPD